MTQDGWGAPRIHGELLKLGFDVSEITVSRYMPRRPVDPDKVKRWMAFLRNRANSANIGENSRRVLNSQEILRGALSSVSTTADRRCTIPVPSP